MPEKNENSSQQGSKPIEPLDLPPEKKRKVIAAIRASIKPFRDVNNPWATYVELHRTGKPPLCVEAESDDFAQWVRHELAVIGSPADVVRSIINQSQDEAKFGPNQRVVALRTAAHGNDWFFNVGGESGTYLKITPDAWTVENTCPVQFVQTRFTQSLPIPDRDGKLEELRQFIRIRDQEWPLFVTWMLAAFSPFGPYPVAAVVGEHGTGKSIAEQFSSALIDPSTEAVRWLPRSDEELLSLAGRRWLLTFDNLSGIPRTMSDALCRISTGTGTTLGQAGGDTSLRRPVMLTSIEDLDLENDLLDRTIWLAIPPLPDRDRHAETRLRQEFKEARPRILGGLLNTLIEARKQMPTVRDTDLPRMADYARMGIAAEAALGLPPGEFLRRYQQNRLAVAEMTVESHPLANLVRLFAIARKSWSGSAQELISTLTKWSGAEASKAAKFLATPRRLSGVLRRAAPSLRRLGIELAFDRSADKREITLSLNRDRSDREERELIMLSPASKGSAGIESPDEDISYVLKQAAQKLAEQNAKREPEAPANDTGKPSDAGRDGGDGPDGKKASERKEAKK